MTVQRPAVAQRYYDSKKRRYLSRHVKHFAKVRLDAKRGARKRTADELFRRAA